MPARATYSHRLSAALRDGSGLCIGFDPSVDTLRAWGLERSAEGLQRFCEGLLEACLAEGVRMVKPQSAFFEQFGWRGVKVLAELTRRCREHGVLVILDAKRGDIGSTSAAYAAACFAQDDPEKACAVTVNPFLGLADLDPFLRRVQEEAVGLFIVTRSSNPGSELFQEATTEAGPRVFEAIATRIHQFNLEHAAIATDGMGPVGAVIGCTLEHAHALASSMPSAPLLCPGIGAQGATPQLAVRRLGSSACRAIFPLSRGITTAGPQLSALRGRMATVRESLASALATVPTS